MSPDTQTIHAPLPWLTNAAACLTVHPDLFCGSPELIPHAKEVCARCPLTTDCLRWALEHGETGVWGGTTLQERRRMGGARKRPIVHGTERGAREHYRRGERPCHACRDAATNAKRQREALRAAS